jgi:ubiquitin-protein ligase
MFFHPNISGTGLICDKLMDKEAATVRVRDRMDEFIILLTTPNPDDAFMTEATKLCRENYPAYAKKARKIFKGIDKKS